MHWREVFLGVILVGVLGSWFPSGLSGQPQAPLSERGEASRYSFGRASRDGTGRFYVGREIAQVMGHLGAPWLERPEREQEEKPGVVLDRLELSPGAVVADIGAGSGYFTRRLSRRVRGSGLVYAVDIQPEMLELLKRRLKQEGIRNVRPVLGTEKDPGLPESSIDLALMVDVYHELHYPFEMLRALCEALKPGGRVAFVEYKAEDPSIPIKPLHKMTVRQIRREVSLHPLREVVHFGDLKRPAHCGLRKD